jgi:hypothetical protein
VASDGAGGVGLVCGMKRGIFRIYDGDRRFTSAAISKQFRPAMKTQIASSIH